MTDRGCEGCMFREYDGRGCICSLTDDYLSQKTDEVMEVINSNNATVDSVSDFAVDTIQLDRLALTGKGSAPGYLPGKDDARKMQGVAGTVDGAVGKE